MHYRKYKVLLAHCVISLLTDMLFSWVGGCLNDSVRLWDSVTEKINNEFIAMYRMVKHLGDELPSVIFSL